MKRLEVEEDLHRELKVQAAKEGETLAVLVNRLLRRALKGGAK